MRSQTKERAATLELLGVPLSLELMEAKTAPKLPTGPGWQFEPKWDGFRCLAFRAGDEVEIKAKSGGSLSRFFPDVVANLRSLSLSTFVLDGELVLPVDGILSFDALQMRLHPAASRIERLSRETRASLILFDCLLKKAGQPLLALSFEKRRAVVETVFAEEGERGGLLLTPFTRDLRKAEEWLVGRHVQVDGVVAKRLDLPSRGSAPCSRSSICALRTVSSAGSATRAAAAAWARCCSASTTTAACFTMSALPRPSLIVRSPNSPPVWKS